MSNFPLPRGWVQQHDPDYDRPYWVDTGANPPRATWVHPYEDEQFLGEHPEAGTSAGSSLDAPPSYDAATASENGERRGSPRQGSHHGERKRGVFGRLKDKAIGTKEEREEHRRMRAAQAARAEEEARQARLRELQEREAYMRAYGGYVPYRPSHRGRTGYPPGTGLGGDNTAALLLGGLAGGLLLGDILGGGLF